MPELCLPVRASAGLLTARAQEVCNRAGGYSAKVQRNDISQQKNAALDTFCSWILHDDGGLAGILEPLQDPLALIADIVDHKGTQRASDGRHFAHAAVGAER